MGGTLTGDAIFTDAAIKEVMTTLVNDRKWYKGFYEEDSFDKHKDWLPNTVMATLYGGGVAWLNRLAQSTCVTPTAWTQSTTSNMKRT